MNIVHTGDVIGIVSGSILSSFTGPTMVKQVYAGINHELGTAEPKVGSHFFQPSLSLFTLMEKCVCDGCEIFQRMIPIEDLDSLGEVFGYEPPNPLCSISYKNNLLGQVGSTLTSCGPDEFGKIVGLLQATEIADVGRF
jgi:hypothetical protein